MATFKASFQDNSSASFTANFIASKNGHFNATFGNTQVIETGDKFFAYTQLAPASIWEIPHPLNKYPSVTVVDSGGSVVVGEVEYVDAHKIIITFQAEFSGKAYLN